VAGRRDEPAISFGGIQASGYGPHEQGRAAFAFCTQVVTVYEDV
jgi:acyl-CoA reductase-like NAD-dependent aldehyde dehydrogenase